MRTRDTSPRGRVAHAIALHRRGVICPTEMWRTIVGALTPETVVAVLDSLTDDAKQELSQARGDNLPAVFQTPHPLDDAQFTAIGRRIVAWCYAHARKANTSREA